MATSDNQLDIELIKRKAISGVVTFTLRTFFVQAFTFFATFVLTILLDPSIFGVFFVVSAILNLFVYFSDIGLAAALIQKKEEPKRRDLTTTFTIQQIIVFTLVVVGLIFSGSIARFYNLDTQGILFLRVLIFSLILSSLKTIPSIILERKLDFGRLVIPQIAENIIFYTTAIVLAYSGFGLTSFSWAVLARGLSGLVIIYFLSPWKPGFSFNFSSAKNLVNFGIPFQLNSILALIKDDLLTVFLGKILTFNQVGYVGWAQKFGFVPLRFFMDNVIKVTFPAYSRLQENRKELAKAIEKSLFFVAFLVYPSVLGILAITPKIVEIIPKYGKWEPAIPLLYFFGINAMFAAVNTTLTNTLFAIGKPKIILNLMVVWTVLIWVLTFILVKIYGFVGVGVASAIVAASTSVTIYFVKKEIPVSIGRNIFMPLFISIIMFFTVKTTLNILPLNIFGLIFAIVIGVIVYFLMSLGFMGKNLTDQIKIIFTVLVSKDKTSQ